MHGLLIRAGLLLALVFSCAAFAQDAGADLVAPADAGPALEEAFDAGALADALDADDEGPDEGEFAEAEQGELSDGGLRYSTDLSDELLLERWLNEPSAIGSISVGLTEAGRLINGVQLTESESCHIVDANRAWGTQETVEFLTAAAEDVHAQFAAAPPLRVNHIGSKNGGYLRPHQSHQAGRDADLGFYFAAGVDPGNLPARRIDAMDLAVNWALVKALLVHGDVQFILVDKRVQARLYDYALKNGEDKTWLDRLFHAGAASMIRHARGHRDHFHVRYFAGRSQELGRRIAPLLAKQPDQNMVIHRVKSGDTLGGLAVKYNSGVKLIQKANGMTNTSLRVGRTLNIPLRGPCTNCPVPPPQVVPPRCLPPAPPPKS